MAYLTSVDHSGPAHEREGDPSRLRGLLRDILAFESGFFKAAFDTYRPEKHYMRGPGPACAAKAARDSKQSR